jgi:hypothetical protein
MAAGVPVVMSHIEVLAEVAADDGHLHVVQVAQDRGGAPVEAAGTLGPAGQHDQERAAGQAQ